MTGCTNMDHVYPLDHVPGTPCACGKKTWADAPRINRLIKPGTTVRVLGESRRVVERLRGENVYRVDRPVKGRALFDRNELEARQPWPPTTTSSIRRASTAGRTSKGRERAESGGTGATTGTARRRKGTPDRCTNPSARARRAAATAGSAAAEGSAMRTGRGSFARGTDGQT